MTTFAPSLANRWAEAKPIPLAPPVMSAVRPTSRRQMTSDMQFLQVRANQSVAMKTFLVSVKASGASGPSSRPSPERLKPPKGVQ